MLSDWRDALPYLVVFLSAVIEGEFVFIAACALVTLGRLNGAAVLICGALGGTAGDQFFFFALRSRIARWLQRFPRVAARHDAIVNRVRRHFVVMALSSRFLPGLRIAIPAACAYADMPALRFSVLNLISAFAWASAIMGVAVWGGPSVLATIGLKGWWQIALPFAILLLFSFWLSRLSSKIAREGPTLSAPDECHTDRVGGRR